MRIGHIITPEEAASKREVQQLIDKINSTGVDLSRQSRTAELWWQYFNQVQLLRLYIRSERTADWSLHLYCVQCYEL